MLGVQLAAVFQSPLIGLRFQVALPAWALMARMRLKRMRSVAFVDSLSGTRLS